MCACNRESKTVAFVKIYFLKDIYNSVLIKNANDFYNKYNVSTLNLYTYDKTKQVKIDSFIKSMHLD